MKIQLTRKFEGVPIIEITETIYLNLLDSIHLFTLDQYLKSWIMDKREIGMIINIVGTWNNIKHIKPILRMKLI
ncbi:hypothetical protein LCGC14_1125980 [marine sediment metagenome]|uniref:Uncharacterized protein n=1 Tax=marine sediment metagenome TaxID=412755 RepID=A0A0F9PKN2_9ZZZZ